MKRRLQVRNSSPRDVEKVHVANLCSKDRQHHGCIFLSFVAHSRQFDDFVTHARCRAGSDPEKAISSAGATRASRNVISDAPPASKTRKSDIKAAKSIVKNGSRCNVLIVQSPHDAQEKAIDHAQVTHQLGRRLHRQWGRRSVAW